jgi:hypothetical protein
MNRDVVNRRMICVASLLALLSGCVGTEMNLLNSSSSPPPPCTPCQVVASWQRQVFYPPDTAHGGVGSPTLAGRVYLYGPQVDMPTTGDGTLTVVAYDGSTPVGPQTVPLPGGAWVFDSDTLHRLLKKDPVGWGYTVPLPWPDLPANLTRLQMKVCFKPTKGAPLYSEVAPLTISNPGPGGVCDPVFTESAKPRGF